MSEIYCQISSPEQAFKLVPNPEIWFRPEWMNAIAALYKIEPKLLICYKNSNPVAILPFYEKRRLGMLMAYNPVLVYYSPPCFILPPKKHPNHNLLWQFEILTALGNYLCANYKRVNLNLPPDVYDIRGLKETCLSVNPVYTFIQDLSSPIEYFTKEMGSLRKAQKGDYAFERSFAPEKLLELVYAMFHRKKHPFDVPIQGHLDFLKNLNTAKMIEQYNVLKAGEIVSSMLVVPSVGDTAYAWQFATKVEDLRNGAGLLMFWEVFKTLSQRFRYLDLCGANSNGPSRLKAAMGAELKLFFQISK